MPSANRSRAHRVLTAILIGVLASALAVLALGFVTRSSTNPASAHGASAPHRTASTSTTSATGSTTAVAANPELDPVGPTTAPAVLGALNADALATPDGVQSAIASLVGDAALGPGMGLLVVDAASGTSLVTAGAATAHTPASTAKILTAVAALSALGPDTTFETAVVSGTPGQIVLVGGGDPALSQRSAPDDGWPYAVTPLATLADKTANALKAAGTLTATLGFDTNLFTGPTLQPGWPSRYMSSGDVGPITALSLDGARRRPGYTLRDLDPPAYAAAQFAALLGDRGVATVVSGATAAPTGAATLATVSSPPVSDLVAQMLTRSDNDVAETMGRQVALALGRPATFDGAGAAISEALSSLGVPIAGLHLVDASGLSRDDLVAPVTLVTALLKAADPGHPDLSSLLAGLPIGGFTGTLADRFDSAVVSGAGDPGAAGDVRAKTGYLRGVVTLAGFVVTDDDGLFAFAFLASAVPAGSDLNAQAALDRTAIRLAGCGCSS